MYPPGNYQGEIIKQGLSSPKPGKSPYAWIEVEIQYQINSENQLVEVGRDTKYINFSFSEAAAPYSVQKLVACGFRGTSFGQMNPTHQNCQDLRGNKVDLYCVHKPKYNQPSVLEDVFEVSAGDGPESLSDEEITKLDSMFGSALKKMVDAQGEEPVAEKKEPAPASTQPTSSRNESEAPPADDVPF